jgi:hypothetical protein
MRNVYRRHKHIRVFRVIVYFAAPHACVNRYLASGYFVLGHLFGRVWNSVPRCAGTVCHSPIKYASAREVGHFGTVPDCTGQVTWHT